MRDSALMLLAVATALLFLPTTAALVPTTELGTEGPLSADPIGLQEAWEDAPVLDEAWANDSLTTQAVEGVDVEAIEGAPEGLLQTASASNSAAAALVGVAVPGPSLPGVGNSLQLNALDGLVGALYCERTSTAKKCVSGPVALFSPNEYRIHWCVGPCSGYGTTDGKIIIHLSTRTDGTGYYSAWCIEVPNGVYSGKNCIIPTQWGSARVIDGELFAFTATGWFGVAAYEY